MSRPTLTAGRLFGRPLLPPQTIPEDRVPHYLSERNAVVAPRVYLTGPSFPPRDSVSTPSSNSPAHVSRSDGGALRQDERPWRHSRVVSVGMPRRIRPVVSHVAGLTWMWAVMAFESRNRAGAAGLRLIPSRTSMPYVVWGMRRALHYSGPDVKAPRVQPAPQWTSGAASPCRACGAAVMDARRRSIRGCRCPVHHLVPAERQCEGYEDGRQQTEPGGHDPQHPPCRGCCGIRVHPTRPSLRRWRTAPRERMPAVAASTVARSRRTAGPGGGGADRPTRFSTSALTEPTVRKVRRAGTGSPPTGASPRAGSRSTTASARGATTSGIAHADGQGQTRRYGRSGT